MFSPTPKKQSKPVKKQAKKKSATSKTDAKSKKITKGKPSRKSGKSKELPKPKRPRSSYVIYANKIRSTVIKENPKLPITEVTKIIGTKWKAITPAEKAKCEKEALLDKKRYEKEKKDYDKKMAKKEAANVEKKGPVPTPMIVPIMPTQAEFHKIMEVIQKKLKKHCKPEAFQKVEEAVTKGRILEVQEYAKVHGMQGQRGKKCDPKAFLTHLLSLQEASKLMK